MVVAEVTLEELLENTSVEVIRHETEKPIKIWVHDVHTGDEHYTDCIMTDGVQTPGKAAYTARTRGMSLRLVFGGTYAIPVRNYPDGSATILEVHVRAKPNMIELHSMINNVLSRPKH